MRPFKIFNICIKMPHIIESKIMKISNNSKFIKTFSCRCCTLQQISPIKIASLQKLYSL